MIIYKCTNTINNKIYVGKTEKSLERRIRGHIANAKHGTNYHFHNALRKFGSDNFRWETIDTARTREELIQKEIGWIDLLKSNNRLIGYNTTAGGDGFTGTHSKESRNKMRLAKLGEKSPTWKGGIKAHPDYERNWQRQWKLKNPNKWREYNNRYYLKKFGRIPVPTVRIILPMEERKAHKKLINNQWRMTHKEHIKEYNRNYTTLHTCGV
jgi:group I intron endonuclease